MSGCAHRSEAAVVFDHDVGTADQRIADDEVVHVVEPEAHIGVAAELVVAHCYARGDTAGRDVGQVNARLIGVFAGGEQVVVLHGVVLPAIDGNPGAAIADEVV